ncbi:WAS/WASL-interacting protein family member 1 [Rhodamnia argentea]|uniref:WAS/WASL-interacting protein family member 1 n=1 Tax=Rhodamnia argentea TaxID=178133 RepID=A0A8B8Q5C1_9MYRT|nr:WAS/WASL-interacting protein family member 1 [Rhodamnia argentea]
MEAVAASYAPDHQPVSPCKQIKAMPRRNHHHNHHSFTVKPSPTSTVHGGGGGGGGGHALLFARPPPPSRSLSFSYPPPSSSPPPISNPLGFNNVPPHHHRGQPPLLPLPKPYSSLSLPAPNSNIRTNKPKSSPSLTPKKPSPKQPKRQDLNNKRKDSKNPGKSPSTPRSANSSADDGVAIIGSTCLMGPDPYKLPRDIFVSKGGSLRGDVGFRSLVLGDLEKFSGSVMYAISPPPSSLPLPKFSLLRQKQLSCNAEAAGVDAGATDDLRRVLRLP